jgi:foldase protein PrsA
MPHLTKKSKKVEKNTPRIQINPERRTRRITYIIASVVIVAAVALVSVAYFQQYVAPFQKVVINIDGQPIVKMRYFVERARVSGSNGLSTIETLTNEEVMKLAEAKYGVSVTQEDIDKALRIKAAGGENITISDFEFNEWYRQTLNNNKIPGNVYRDIVAAELRTALFQDYVNKTIPASIDHAHVYAIFLNTYDEALNVKNRVDGGEDFFKIAREISIDETTRESGGDVGWIPKGVYLFNNDPFSLEIGKTSDVLAVADSSSSTADTSSSTTPTIQAYYVEIVTEVAVRPIEDYYIAEVQSSTYKKWLDNETKSHTVKWNYNSEIDAWLNWELSKLSTATTTASTTATGG